MLTLISLALALAIILNLVGVDAGRTIDQKPIPKELVVYYPDSGPVAAGALSDVIKTLINDPTN